MLKYLYVLITTLLFVECSSQNSDNMQYKDYSESIQLRRDDRGSAVNYNNGQINDDSSSTQINNATLNKYRDTGVGEIEKAEVRNIDSNASDGTLTSMMIVIVYLFIIIWICNKVCKKEKKHNEKIRERDNSYMERFD